MTSGRLHHRRPTAPVPQAGSEGPTLSVVSPWRGSGRRRGGALTLLLGCAAIVAGVVTLSASSRGAARTPTLSKAIGTATVARRDLMSQDTETGTLGYTDAQSVVNRLAGTITWLPAAGSVVRPGSVLLRVDATPVILLDGSVPAYRALSPSAAAGPDIAELKRDLVSLGFAPGGLADTDRWEPGVTAAVDRLRAAHGLPRTGALELGRVVFLHGARRVSTLTATIGSAGAGAGGGGAGASAATASAGGTRTTASLTLGTGGRRFADYQAPPATTATTPPPAASTPATPAPAPATPAPAHRGTATPTHTPAVPRTAAARRPARGRASSRAQTNATSPGGSGASSAGSTAGSPATTVMTTTSTRQVVTVAIDTGKVGVAKAKEPVGIQLPSGTYVNGHVAAIGRVAQAPSASAAGGSSSAGSSTAASVTVTITLDRAQSSNLDQAPVTVSFSQGVARNALSVPVTALLATPGGGFAVQLANGATHRDVPVTPGVYTSGYVQISGDVREGDIVTNASE